MKELLYLILKAFAIHFVRQFDIYEYFVEHKNGEVCKVTDSIRLLLDGVKEYDFRDRFITYTLNNNIEAFITRCA